MKKILIISITLIIFGVCNGCSQQTIQYVAAPNFSGQVIRSGEKQDVLSLTQVSVKPINTTDTDEWFSTNDLKLDYKTYNFFVEYKSYKPENLKMKRLFPAKIGEYDVMYCEEYDSYYAVYYTIPKEGYNGVFLLALYDKQLRQIASLDFSTFMYAPKTKQGDEDYVRQTISHAHLVDNILYVQHGHRTYAASSYNQNAYISAINITDGNIIWTSEPLTCNSNFIIVGNSIICGYGFTAEPDYLYIVDINTGERKKQYKLDSAPVYIAKRGNQIYVSTYYKDYEFRIPYSDSTTPPPPPSFE